MSTARALLACLAISCPVLVSAQSIVQSFSFGPVAFDSGFGYTYSTLVNQFNPALGTLNSTTLSFSFDYNGSVTLGSNPGGFGYSPSGSVTWNGNILDSLGGSGSGGGGGPFQNINFSGSFNYGTQTPPGLSYVTVIGTGTATLAYGASVSVSPPSGSTVSPGQLSNGTLILTYNYTAIPEPGTYALFAGLAGLSAVVWHRRQRIGIPSRR